MPAGANDFVSSSSLKDVEELKYRFMILNAAASLVMCRAHKFAAAGITETGLVGSCSRDNRGQRHGVAIGSAAGTKDIKLHRKH